jgi:hypothetical protein
MKIEKERETRNWERGMQNAELRLLTPDLFLEALDLVTVNAR